MAGLVRPVRHDGGAIMTSTGGLAVAVVLFMMVFDSGTEGVL